MIKYKRPEIVSNKTVCVQISAKSLQEIRIINFQKQVYNCQIRRAKFQKLIVFIENLDIFD
jgi:hypothetical protein